MKKFAISIILFCIVTGSVLTPVHQARAFLGFGDLVIEIEKFPFDWNSLIDGIHFIAKKAVIAAVRKSLVQYVQTGNFREGAGPILVSNFKEHLLNELDAEFAGYLSDVTNTDICSPFKITIESLLKLNYPRYDHLENDATCTISEALRDQGYQLNDYYADFRNGGWDAWIEHNKPRNTPLGALAAANEEAQKRLAQNKEGTESELDAGGGYVGIKVCQPDKKTDDGRCLEYKILTPGTLVGDQVARYFGADLDNFIQADTWKEFIYGLGGLLVARLLDSTLGGLIDSDPTSFNDGGDGGSGGEGDICVAQPDCQSGLLCAELGIDRSGTGNKYCQASLAEGEFCRGVSQGIPVDFGNCGPGLGCYPSVDNPSVYACATNPGEAGLGDACSDATFNVPAELQCNRTEGLVCKSVSAANQTLKFCAKRDGQSCISDGDCNSGNCTFNVCQP